MNKKLIYGLIPVALITLLLTGGASTCGYLSIFEKTYPSAVNSSIDTCELCHINPSGAGLLNPYGADFANNGHNFTAIELNDSDGDGFTNIAEINATTFPGKSLDNPLSLKQAPALDGAAFYSTYCSSCHNPLASSSKLGATAAHIQIAINTVPEMKSLSSLRMVNLQAIAAALDVSPSSSPTTATDRAALYASYCQGCHNPLATSTKRGRTADQIKTSISSVSAMKSLSSLNSDQIQGIAIALGASSASLTSLPTLTLDGSALYAGNCAGCHNSLSYTTKPGRTAALIQNAIYTVPNMNSLSSLGIEQIHAIAAALPSAPVPIPPPPPTTSLDGPTLYADFCTSCHSSLESSTISGRTSAQITNAINSVPAMSSLSSLSADQIAAVAAILPSTMQTTTNLTTDGVALYAGNCAGCHNSLAFTNKPGRNSTQITNAISTVSGMRAISSLTSAQIAAIASVLPPAPASTATATILDGTALYAGNCAGCHNSLAFTNKPGRSAANITNAISTNYAMNSLSYLASLSSAQIAAIASVLPAAPASVAPTTILDGTALYAGNCAGCHGSLASTTKPGRSAANITNAISTNYAMNSLSYLASLTPAQIAAIASVLPAAPASTAPTTILDGAALYAGNCAGCHGSLALTTKPGRSAANITNAISTNYAMNSLSYLASLTPAQIAAIASVLPAAPASTAPTTILDGTALYAGNCAGCHGSLALTTKPGRSATDITNAISTNYAMNSLSYLTRLTSAQIAAIASVLPPVPTPSPTPVTTPAAPATLDGPTLYTNDCSGCHGSLATSAKLGRTEAQITGAISSVGSMNTATLRALTSTQVTAIANALAVTSTATPTPTPTATPTPTTTPPLSGATLYTNDCSSCHGSLATSAKLGRTASQITGAISSVGSMNTATLRALTSTQVTAIANALVVTSTATPTPTTTPASGSVSYSATIQPILNTYCNACHPTSGVSFSSYTNTKSTVVAGNATGSRLYRSLTGSNGVTKMPPSTSSQLTTTQITSIRNWINQGALNN
ncbi:MAG: hypothetical protein O8C61_00875 [Candidatus Methanoperedens sp.]|nr:hypothetical protein [Candidatus Methanoperedens sp.]